jgi:hypothetical protein
MTLSTGPAARLPVWVRGATLARGCDGDFRFFSACDLFAGGEQISMNAKRMLDVLRAI